MVLLKTAATSATAVFSCHMGYVRIETERAGEA